MPACCGLHPQWFGGLFKQCDPPECCCGCCSALRPRYKRLVDNIFPTNPQDGLVKNNMEKLTFYASSSPEKLDRIGEYLAQKTARNLVRHRMDFVRLAMDAMDQILVACRTQSLNLFVESFLKTVQQLLESHDPHMQLLATQSFVKFANIDEDTPSYHRRYDFFVSKFASLCHNNDDDANIRRMLRLAGLNGIKGVVRKTVTDDLQVDIWDKNHMDKIVPSLLYNMQDRDALKQKSLSSSVLDSRGSECNNPAIIAEECLRQLVGRASFGNIESVVRPVLKHLDNHMLWDSPYPDGFSATVFKIIIDSMHPQHYHEVIQKLMHHLDEKSKSLPSDDSQMKTRERTEIVNVLSQIVAIAAAESIGPSVHLTINSLLSHLRNSIHNAENDSESADDEKRFQESVINTLAEFVNNLPDFQKIETMVVIINKVPPISSKYPADIQLQDILLKSLLKVSTKYRTVNMAQAFKYSFLRPLLSMSLAADAKVRLTVQHIFHQLLDRHSNLPKLSKPNTLRPCPKLTMDNAHRQDLMFMNKHGSDLLMHIYENSRFANNNQDNFDSIYTTLALLCVEMGSEEVLTELFRVVFALQDLGATSSGLSEAHKSAIHGIVAGFLHLTAGLTAIPTLGAHVEQVISSRKERNPAMLPEYSRCYSGRYSLGDIEKSKKSSPDDISEELLFNKNTIAEALRSSGHDTTRLMTPLLPDNAVVDSSMSRSTSDLNSIHVDVESNNSSPRTIKKFPGEDITFESFRKLLYQSGGFDADTKVERRVQIYERFKNEPFESLIAKTEEKGLNFRHQLSDIFTRLSHNTNTNNNSRPKPNKVESTELNAGDSTYDKTNSTSNPFAGLYRIMIDNRRPPLFAIQFPDLFEGLTCV